MGCHLFGKANCQFERLERKFNKELKKFIIKDKLKDFRKEMGNKLLGKKVKVMYDFPCNKVFMLGKVKKIISHFDTYLYRDEESQKVPELCFDVEVVDKEGKSCVCWVGQIKLLKEN